MPYVTSTERNAEARGLEQGLERGRLQGREQGSITLLLRLLTRRCGALPEELDQEVRQLSLEQSQCLGEALLDFEGLDDVRAWLKSNIAQQE